MSPTETRTRLAVADVFPAKLTTPDRTFEKVRVSVRDGVLRAFHTVAGRIELAWETAIDAETLGRDRGGRRASYSVVTASGQALVFDREGHCGCRDPLKRFDPRRWKPE